MSSSLVPGHGQSPSTYFVVPTSSNPAEMMANIGSTRSSISSFSSASPICNSSTPSSSHLEIPLSRLCLGGEIVAIPSAIIQEESVFREVITKDAYRCLSPEGQQYLKRFLPKYEGAERDEEVILETAFTSDPNCYFGNSMGKVHSKIRCGYFNPERPSAIVQLRDNRRVLYDHNIRHYYISLLKKLLIARRRLLERFYNTGESDEIARIPPRPALIRKRDNTRRLKARAKYRIKIMLDEIKKELNDDNVSSDDEDLPTVPIEGLNFAGKSTLYDPNFSDLDLHHDIGADEVKDMLKEYRRLKETQPDLPSMDISGITVEEVYQRAKLPCIAEKNLTPEVSEAMKQPFRPHK